MYQIREFSYLCKTTIKTLRHYEKVGVFFPKEINQLTGYRYYDNCQVKTFEKIKTLQDAGFTLKEIKEIMSNPNKTKLHREVLDLISDYQEKLDKLQDLKEQLHDEIKIELITNPKLVFVGEYKRLKSRADITNQFAKIDKKIGKFYCRFWPKVVETYTVGYQENNIICFIGRVAIRGHEYDYDTLSKMKKEGLEVIVDFKPQTMLHIETNENMENAYQKLIKYANQNNIQIRGAFKEIYGEENNEIYVEAYDLTKENSDAIKFENQLANKFATTEPKFDPEFVGKWKLMGEQVEPTKLFDPTKEHYIPDTELQEIILNSDGSTNFKKITWRDKYIIITKNDSKIYCSINIDKNKRKKYLMLLLKSEKSSERPIRLYYKKEK